MKKKITNTHYTLETRTIIENKLNEGLSITNIADDLRRDRSNLGREIMKHRKPFFPTSFNNLHPCLKCETCSDKGYECYKYCKNLEINLCEKLISSPHVCNGCTNKQYCRHVKYYYKACEANNEYESSWKKDRKGLHYTELELTILNNDFRNLVLNNRSIYHSLIVINKRGFNFKLKTIYKQIERGQLSLQSFELPRYRNNSKPIEKDKSYKRENIEGNTFEDYEKYKDEHNNAIEMQMDTVEGIKENNAPVLLTLELVKIKFIFIFKLPSQTADEVTYKLKFIRDTLGNEITDKIFEILLTDNGKEFIKLSLLKETLPKANIFYCHPYSSYEKGAIENNHELIRRVIPKGVSLKNYTQGDLNLLCSHINSLYRESLDGKCPFDLINDYIPSEILEKLNLKKIDDNMVNLTPYLLGEKNINNITKYLDKNKIREANILL